MRYDKQVRECCRAIELSEDVESLAVKVYKSKEWDGHCRGIRMGCSVVVASQILNEEVRVLDVAEYFGVSGSGIHNYKRKVYDDYIKKE